MNQSWVFDRESFYDFLGFVIHCAPDFPEKDFLESHEQLDLEKAFDELHNGLAIVQRHLSPAEFQEAQQLLEKSLSQFKDGDEIAGAHSLQNLDRLLIKKR